MGWILVNIAVPLVAPIVALLLLKSLPLPDAVRPALKWYLPVKDGQLCWIAIAFCASALYDYAAVSNGNSTSPARIMQFANGFATAVLVASSILAAGGALFRTPVDKGSNVSWAKHYSCFCVSTLLVLVSSVLYVIIHFGMQYC